jgi:hypothetical protein
MCNFLRQKYVSIWQCKDEFLLDAVIIVFLPVLYMYICILTLRVFRSGNTL